MGRGSGATTFRAVTSRGGGLTPTSRAKKAGAYVRIPEEMRSSPYRGQVVRIQGLTRNGARATINMGEGPNTVLLSKSELQAARPASAPRRGR